MSTRATKSDPATPQHEKRVAHRLEPLRIGGVRLGEPPLERGRLRVHEPLRDRALHLNEHVVAARGRAVDWWQRRERLMPRRARLEQRARALGACSAKAACQSKQGAVLLAAVKQYESDATSCSVVYSIDSVRRTVRMAHLAAARRPHSMCAL
jgi:hypothetical protein